MRDVLVFFFPGPEDESVHYCSHHAAQDGAHPVHLRASSTPQLS